jgi:hypothetical protein
MADTRWASMQLDRWQGSKVAGRSRFEQMCQRPEDMQASCPPCTGGGFVGDFDRSTEVQGAESRLVS